MRKKRRQRGAHRMTSNVFNMFNQQQIQEFKGIVYTYGQLNAMEK